MKPILPTWSQVASGHTVSRIGGFMFEFANGSDKVRHCFSLFASKRLLFASPLTPSKSYDWSKKQVFFLSVAEMGRCLVELAPGGTSTCEFLHDPNAGTGAANSGGLKKLKFSPDSSGKSVFVSLAVGTPPTFTASVPADKAEVAVMLELFRFAIPRALGIDEVFAAGRGGEGEAAH
jgi:hypothetical protein